MADCRLRASNKSLKPTPAFRAAAELKRWAIGLGTRRGIVMKERKLNPFWHLLLVIALLWLSPGAQGASAQTKVSIANLIVSSSHLPLWIAHEQGLFMRHGIAAEILIVEDASRR